MEGEINRKNGDNDLLSQSYSEGLERVVGCKDNASFKIPPNVIKKREQFWDELFNRYSRKLPDDIEVDIATLQSFQNVPFKSVSFIQYWVNTGNFPCKALMDDKNCESDISLIQEESSNSLHSHIIKEKSNEHYNRPNCSASSFSTSIDTAAYILSNMNTTNKVETMAIVEGAKHDASTNQNKCCENVETVQFATENVSNKDNENIMLDNNSDAYQICLATSPLKPTEHLTQQTTNNLQENVMKTPTHSRINTSESLFSRSVDKSNVSNCNSERYYKELFDVEMAHTIHANRQRNSNIRRTLLNATHIRPSCSINESSTLEGNTIKLNSRKKLYSGRDSPVDLVRTRISNKIVLTKPNQNLHPALDPVSKIPRRYRICKKRQQNHFFMFNKYMLNSSSVSFSSCKKHKRKRKTLNHMNGNSSIINVPKKRNVLNPEKTANNPMKNQSLTKSNSMQPANSSPSPNGSVSTNNNKESKLDHSIVQVKKFINQFSENSNNARRTLIHLNPRICLSRLSKRDIENYKHSNKTTTSLRNLCPVVRLNRLAEPDIQRYKKPSRMAMKLDSVSPINSLKQLSKFSTPERRKSTNSLSNLRFRNPVVCLKKLSELDVKQYKSQIIQSQSRNTAHLSRQSSPKGTTVHLIEDSDSEGTTLLICECKSLTSQSESSPIKASKNCSLVKNDTPNNSVLHKTLETTQNKVCRNNIMSSSSSSGSDRIAEKRSTRKSLNASVNSLEANKSVLPKEDWRENHDTISAFDESGIGNKNRRSNGACANKITNTGRKSHEFLLSDEDDEFVNLIHYHEERKKSKLRTLHKSAHNSDDSVEIQNTAKTEVNYATNNELQCLRNKREGAMRSMSTQLLPKSIEKNAKLENQRDYFYAKRYSNVPSCGSEEENINHANPVSVQKSNLKILSARTAHGRKLNKLGVILRNRKELLTNMDIKRRKSSFDVNHLRFQTKAFDTDSESSFLS